MDSADKPHVFVGSSREGLDIARAIQFHLHDAALVTVWNEGVFGLTEGTLESLVRTSSTFDFAILIITPDDIVTAADGQRQAPRDNVMFELGLFMGRLGPTRTFAVCCDSSGLKLPSDLAGVTMARFNSDDATRDVTAALGPAAFQLRRTIRELGHALIRPLDPESIIEAVTLVEVRCNPHTPKRGDTLTLEYLVESALPSVRVWLGANLNQLDRYIYNTAQDTEVTLVLGRQMHARHLTIPADVQPGIYGLQVEIWFGFRSHPDRSIPLASRWPDRMIQLL
jgi:hypothetical protein